MTDSVTARRVRDTTIKHAISSERDFMSLFDGEMRSFDSISISRRVSAMTKYVYKIAKKRDAAIGRVLVKSRKGGKHDLKDAKKILHKDEGLKASSAPDPGTGAGIGAGGEFGLNRSW